MGKRKRIKSEYLMLVMAYAFMFMCMPSLHCHIQYLDLSPHCFHCHGHIEAPLPADDDTCDFCPVINFNTVTVCSLFTLPFFVLSKISKLFEKEKKYKFIYEKCEATRGPPFTLNFLQFKFNI